LQHQVVVANRIKTMNESIYYNVDKIHDAISSDVKITYRYCEWTLDKRLTPKKNGTLYTVSPWVMTWDDENYYLIAYDDASSQIRHYRVDKMLSINLTKEKRIGRAEFDNFDIAQFSKRTFGMFAGNESELTIRFANSLIGVVMDRFGKDISIHKSGTDTFDASVRVNISAQFYGWLTALGTGVKILSPAAEASNYADYIKGISALYQNS
jgi:predicted DNA-binding transcriptional regulator YafY